MHLRFVTIALATAATLAAAWIGLFYLEFGMQTQTSYERCENVRLKREIGQGVGDPKLVVIAGSSAARGVNAEILSQVTGRRAVNFGLFAAVGPDLILYEARRILKPGDVALLALEYNHFAYDAPTADAIDYVLGCGGQYFRELPWFEKLRYVFGLNFERIYRSLRLNPRTISKGISQPGITAQGDIKLTPEFFPPLSESTRTRMSLYRPMQISINPQSYGAQAVSRFIAWAKENHITVLATWPNTIYFPEYRQTPCFDDLRRFYADRGVTMVGAVSSSLLPLSLFYNTQYHLNIAGIKVRSKQLGCDLLTVLPSTTGIGLSAVDQ
jgi:hypothetical protein